MALPARRSYAGAAEACTLTSNISNSATSFSITGTTTAWPSTATGPFYMVIDPGLSTEEKVLVGARTTGSLSSVTRGVDGTSAAAHDAGATCYPVLTAVDLNEANLLASTMTTKGDLLSTDGSDPKRVAVGSNNTRLVADSAQTSGIKWVADTQNTVVDAKGDLLAGTAADTVGRLAVGSNDQVLVAASGETTGLKWGMPAGTVIQVVSNETTTGTSSASTTSLDTALSANITPKYATSKVLVMVNQQMYFDSANLGANLRLVRGSTEIMALTYQGYGGASNTQFVPITMVDSPNTTSQVTYKTTFNRNTGTGIVYCQPNADQSFIVLMEIAG